MLDFLYTYSTWNKILDVVNPNTILNPSPRVSLNSNIIYNLNSLNYRSREFETLDSGNINILFSGCSWTYGTGMHEELIWPQVLSNLIKEKTNNNVISYNLSTQGGSIFLVIKNIMEFIRVYGTPQYIFIKMPPIARDLRYDIKTSSYYSVLMGNSYFENDYPKVYLEYIKSHKHEDSILKAVDQIKLFEDYCNMAGIKMYWSFWHELDRKVFESIKFDNIVFPSNILYPYDKGFGSNEGRYKNVNDLPLWEIAEDKSHPGSAWHEYTANMFLEQVSNEEI
jgi:hypothetical protein